MPKINGKLSRDNGQVRLSLAVTGAKKAAVDAEKGTLSDVLLMQGDREAAGHGIYIDAKTLSTALEAVNKTGGQIRGYYTHDHRGGWMGGWENMLEESASEMAIPGYFSGLKIEKNQLIASEFSFYDAFRAAHPDTVAQIVEMASKTPDLLAQSLELWGYAVFVGKDGTEYTAEPEDEDMLYDGMPVMRVTDVFGSAFVAAGAATDGLFARLSRKVRGTDIAPEVRESLKTIFAEFSAEQTNQEKHDMDLIKALKAAIKDEARLGRALSIVAKSDNPESLTVASITAQLAAEDAAQESAKLSAQAGKSTQLEAQLELQKAEVAKMQEQLSALKTMGQPTPVNLGAPAGAEGKAVTGLTLKYAPKLAAKGVNLAIASVADFIIPEIWIPGMTEPIVEGKNIMTSPAIASSPLFAQIASGPSDSANIPFFKEPDFADAIQIEGMKPTVNGISHIKQVAPILNRVSACGVTALAAAVSGTDPLGEMLMFQAKIRMRQRQTTLLNILRGAFGAHTDTTAAFNALRSNLCTTSGSLVAGNLIDLPAVLTLAALLGDAVENLEGGVLWIHPDIKKALLEQDIIDYDQPSTAGTLTLRNYRGCQIFTNSALKTTATINSVPSVPIYRSYLFAPRSIAVGDKPQTTNVGDVASITTEALASTNNREVFDRTRFLMQPSGLSWKGTPAGQSASNAELATIANWELAKNADTSAEFDPKNVGIVELITNG